MKIAIKMRDEYAAVAHLSAPAAAAAAGGAPAVASASGAAAAAAPEAAPAAAASRTAMSRLIDSVPSAAQPGAAPPPGGAAASTSGALVLHAGERHAAVMEALKEKSYSSAAVSRRIASKWPRPAWHAPWRCYRVISGHLGAVRSLAFDPANEWFVTGSADRTIRIWDLATGQLKLTLTGHIEQVTGLAVSPRHPYMFSAGLDKSVKCVLARGGFKGLRGGGFMRERRV